MYLAPADIQVARVDRQAIVYFCSALAHTGVAVRLAALRIRLSPAERHRPADPLDLYGIETRFPVDSIPTALHQDSRRWLVAATRFVAYLAYSRQLLRATSQVEAPVFYLKNYAPALGLILLRGRRRASVVFEAHAMPRGWLHRFVLRRVNGVVANSGALARDLRTAHPSLNVLATHQGVDLSPYRELDPVGRVELRRRLELPETRPLVVYTGKIAIGSREVDYILRAAAQLPDEVAFVLVGGREDHVAHWRTEARRRGLDNVCFTGFVAPREIQGYQVAADVLVLYYPSGEPLNAYRSPGKLFGYMAAGTPIVAVDLPVLREVLGDPATATLVPPDDPDELAAAIGRVLADPAGPSDLALLALRRVQDFTWAARAQRVAAFVDALPASDRASVTTEPAAVTRGW